MKEIFQYGQVSNRLHPKLVSSLRGNDYDIATFLFAENFFSPFQKTVEETELLNTFVSSYLLMLRLKQKPV